MDIIKRAEEYAANKAIDYLTKMIAQAYEDGYRDGYNESRETLITNIAGDAGEFVDLGLPSGTLWASKNLEQEGRTEYLPYDKAIRFSLPTEEQWKELWMNCEWNEFDSIGTSIYKMRCVGPNGNEIVFVDCGMYKGSEKTSFEQFFFWLRNDQTDDISSRNVAEIKRVKGTELSIQKKTGIFKGFKLPVRLVKNKA